MSTNSVYQSIINNKLKLNKLSPNNFATSRVNFNNPDAMFIYGDNQYRLELKNGLGNEYCNGVLAYKDGAWVVDKADDGEMLELLKSIGVESFARKKWGEPRKGTKNPLTKDDKQYDIKTFKDQDLQIKSSSLHSYYASKGTDYIQVHGYGMYYMSQNPAGLPIPQFNPNLKIKIKLKQLGSDYQFLTSLQLIGRPVHSGCDIDKNVDFLVEK